MPGETEPKVWLWKIGPHGKGTARWVPLSELEPEVRRRIEAVGLDPERWPEPMRLRRERFLAHVAKGAPAFAIARGELPEGAAAILIRDPAAPIERLVVVSERTVDDEVLALAEGTLRQEEIHVPAPPSRRVLTVFTDRRVRIETSRAVHWVSFRMDFFSERRRKHTDRLIAWAAGAPEVELPGIGRARLVRTPQGRWP